MAINKIMVLGAGTMGMGIAQVFAEAGKTVIVRDIKDEFIQRGEGVLKKNLEKKVSKGKISVEDMDIGMVHNFKLMRGILDTPEGKASLVSLLRTASIFGNGQMQFLYIDNDTLRKAQADPDKYRDLVIRVFLDDAYEHDAGDLYVLPRTHALVSV